MDYDKFEEELIDLLICTEYERENPINVNNCTCESINLIPYKAKEYYLTDPHFCARINFVVSNIIKLARELEEK